MGEKILDFRDKKIQGNILDLGYRDYGVIYNICKRDCSDMDINYLNKETQEHIEMGQYHNCVLFFSLKNMWTNHQKEEVFNFAHKALSDDGEIYIWDIDKPTKKIYDYKIKVILSENNTRIINIKDFNLFNNNSKENIIKLLTCKFDIIDFDYNDEVFFIRAKKKGC